MTKIYTNIIYLMVVNPSNDNLWNNVITLSEFNPMTTYLFIYSLFLLVNYVSFQWSTLSTLCTNFLLYKTHIINSIVLALKFIVLIALFIFIRGGIPRYRYDFLTKMGWIKFLSLVLSVFLSSILLTYLC